MKLEDRVTALEEKYWSTAGEQVAMQAALLALGSEPDWTYHYGLLKDYLERARAIALGLATTDEQHRLLHTAFEAGAAAMLRAFEQPHLLPEFRQPLRRQETPGLFPERPPAP